jgi:uncharacterized membrane protein YphA (DoxX/SURF4 family)
MPERVRSISVWLGRLALAIVFGAAAVPKLLDPAGFAGAIDNYHLLPSLLTRVAAVGLPVLELSIAIGVLVPRLARGAGALAACLLALFSAAMVQAILRDIDLDCGCFGTSTELGVNWWSVARNLGLCALAIWTIATTRVSQPTRAATLTQT